MWVLSLQNQSSNDYIAYHTLVSAASVNLTPSLNETGEMASFSTSLVMSIEMSAGDFTPRSI